MSNPIPDHAYWIALSYVVRGEQLRKLFEHFSSGVAAWRAGRNEYAGLALRQETLKKIISKKSELDPATIYERCLKDNIVIITLGDKHYPTLLRQIPDAPAVLFVKGNILSVQEFPLAVVGTRKFSDYGKAVALKLSRELARAGFTIVSGLARGVDGLAHEAAIDAGGRTVAVIGSGLDRASLYPREHWRLAEALIEHDGCVISEYPPCIGPEPHHFPERNRIIAGLSLGVLVIEAPEKSGALITAYQALEYNREVLAVPGHIFDKNARGVNELLRRGATLVASVENIATALGLEMLPAASTKKSAETDLTDEERVVFQTLGHEPTYIDSIIAAASLPSSVVGATLSALELKGLIKDVGGKKYVATK